MAVVGNARLAFFVNGKVAGFTFQAIAAESENVPFAKLAERSLWNFLQFEFVRDSSFGENLSLQNHHFL
jgi:hypothetical protein